MFCFIIHLLSLINGCKCSKDNEQSAVSGPIQYLPLVKGNKWIYKRTVLQSKNICNWAIEVDLSKNEKSYMTRGYNPGISEVTSFESYLIGDEIIIDGNKFWKIRIDGELIRDGRYEGIGGQNGQTFWGRIAINNDYTAIEERIKYRYGVYAGPYEKRIMLLPEPVQNIKYNIDMGSVIIIQDTIVNYEISVPAGDFSKCLKIVTKVKLKEGDTPPNLRKTDKNVFVDSWETHSYYAPNVGLVKEVQKDYYGNDNYILELESYNVNIEKKSEIKMNMSEITAFNAKELAEKAMIKEFKNVELLSIFATQYSLIPGKKDKNKYNVDEWLLIYKNSEYDAIYCKVNSNSNVKIFLEPDFRTNNDEVIAMTIIYKDNTMKSHEMKEFYRLNGAIYATVKEEGDIYSEDYSSSLFNLSKAIQQSPPLKNININNDMAMEIAVKNGGFPAMVSVFGCGIFLLQMKKFNNSNVPIWILPHRYPDHLRRGIRADNGDILYFSSEQDKWTYNK